MLVAPLLLTPPMCPKLSALVTPIEKSRVMYCTAGCYGCREIHKENGIILHIPAKTKRTFTYKAWNPTYWKYKLIVKNDSWRSHSQNLSQ